MKNTHKRKTHKKGQLPTKLCVTCAKPFEWRKKWQKDWEQVKYCSERCQKNRPI